jgi:transcription initiation factor TFIIIB Brf1 subunit/transcription initiation factor TFIIB
MKCPKCGYDNVESAIFCTHCGTALNEKNQLSDTDRQRIADEEKERMKIREQLQAQEKGKKQNLPKWAWVPIGCGGVVVFIIIIAVIGAVKGSNSNTLHIGSATTTVYFNSSASQTLGVIDVNYDDLYQLASTNEIAYDSEYRGRTLQLSNLRVDSVQSTANPRVNLTSAGGKSFTLYFITESNK